MQCHVAIFVMFVLQDLDCDPFNSSSSMFNTSDLTRPEYSTDNFRMFCFKVRIMKKHGRVV